jgi:adenylylsulfate kinase-like enzyme
MVIWIIGLSGAGKTTLANEVIAQVRFNQNNTVLIDGDMVREVFGNDLGHSMDDRRKNANRICQLGKFLDQQGVNVVCAILSLFPESRTWNRENIENYYEVFIDTPISTLIERDSKGLYRKFNNGEIHDVAGMDINFPRPDNSDLIINNIKSKEDLLSFANIIVKKITSDGL